MAKQSSHDLTDKTEMDPNLKCSMNVAGPHGVCEGALGVQGCIGLQDVQDRQKRDSNSAGGATT